MLRKKKTKNHFLYLKFNMLSSLVLAIQGTRRYIISLGHNLSKVGGYDFSKIRGVGKVGGLIQSRMG